ncbi:zf-HC2 domain-containing protein [Streptomyces sp. DSM 41921]|uniref:Zf-HC2 domain-containing protein n=1 Tax=Streptomyces dubilierae TaxID=3075533 RepID=A0ABU2P5Y1_9ACTN|nr:zf-HC2 domain-containing protein [Streptomyces sp. DSM 41921]MDT0387049.1 zf-HC2 domain-containing protein [Streptomyces sp. DSM 41921]
MSGSRPKASEGHLAEQHLGDRLSALVDGELGHDARERVLAHVATCPKCKAEVDAQRRLKNVFAEAAPPPPSESFLARLQGLPAGGGPDGDLPPGGAGLPGGRFGSSGAFPTKRDERFEFGYAPSRPHLGALPPSAGRALAAGERGLPSGPDGLPAGGRGFRIHDVGRSEPDRSSSRLRFAFVAAGAVSLAAIALGGVTAGTPTDTEARGGSGTGSNVTPMRTQGTGAATAPESQRRRGAGPLLGQLHGQNLLGRTPAAPTEVSAPLLPGVPAPSARHGAVHALTAPVVAGAAAMSPLIRPLQAAPPAALTSWSALPEITAPLLAVPLPDAGSSPSAPTSSRTAR